MIPGRRMRRRGTSPSFEQAARVSPGAHVFWGSPGRRRLGPRFLESDAVARSTTKRPPVRRSPAKAAARTPAAQQPRPTWISGARPRTLPLAVAPVALGTGAAVTGSGAGFASPHLWLGWLCLAVSLLLQIGVNFANDYSDGVRGTDRFRVGPPRLTASGRVRPRTVLGVALACFALAAAAGVVIVVVTQVWWLLAVGAAAI